MNIGVDVGGSHIAIGVVGANGKITKYRDTYIKKGRGNIGKFIIKEILSTVEDWSNSVENVENIGIAVPGVIVDNKIVNSVNLRLSNFDLKGLLQKHLENVNVTVHNDAKCAALAEKKYGTLKKFDDCLFLCLGTGIGGAYFYNGKLVSPKRCPGFEFGHMVIEKNGRPCRCGNHGCFEQYASMKKFKNDIRNALNLPSDTEGEKLRNLIKKNIHNDSVKFVIDEYIDNLVLGLSNIVNMLEPQAICIGGGFSKYDDILMKKLKHKMSTTKNLFYKKNRPQIFIAKFGNNAGIIGATL